MKKKMNRALKTVGHYQVHQHNESSKRRREKEAENVFKEIMSEDSPNLMKSTYLHFQDNLQNSKKYKVKEIQT